MENPIETIFFKIKNNEISLEETKQLVKLKARVPRKYYYYKKKKNFIYNLCKDQEYIGKYTNKEELINTIKEKWGLYLNSAKLYQISLCFKNKNPVIIKKNLKKYNGIQIERKPGN